MLSRVADSIYWMSRNVERAENLARYVDVTFNLLLDTPEGSQEQWEPLINTTGDRARFLESYGEFSRQNVIWFLAFDQEYPSSVLSCLKVARENARSIRETISSEMYEHLNHYYHMVKTAALNREHLDSPQDFCHEVRLASHLFNGITD